MTGRPRRTPPLSRSLAWRQAAAWLALLWERLWPALWPAASLSGVFIASACMGAWAWLAPWPHAILLGLLALAGAILLGLGFARFKVPSREDARRRLEIKGGLAHRPLAALSDRPAAGTSAAGLALWQRHLALRAGELRHLRIGLPRPNVAARDPWGLRAAAVLLVVVGLAVAGGTWRQRLFQALHPELNVLSAPPDIDAWIDPPAYTGLPPIFLTREGHVLAAPGAKPLPVPAGSLLQAEVHGGSGQPELLLDGTVHRFTALGGANHQITLKLTGGRRLALRQDGRRLALWRLNLVPDLPPTIAFAQKPEETPRHALRILYQAHDDYGVTKVWLEIRRKAQDKPVIVPLPLDLGQAKDPRATSYLDLTAQIWAGLPVTLTLVASDAIGQTGRSAPQAIRLPARDFHQPVARALVEQRRLLAESAGHWQGVALALSAIATLHDAYRDDLGIFLGLTVAEDTLRRDRRPTMLPKVEDLLWDAALQIEDGDLGVAERALRQAEDALRQALAAHAPQSVIEQRMQALRQALDRFLAELGNQERQAQAEAPPPGNRTISPQDLQRLLEGMETMEHSGARDAARAMLDRLQGLLESLRSGNAQAGAAGQAGAAANALNRLLQRQQKLLDDTFGLARRQTGNSEEPGAGQQTSPALPGARGRAGGSGSAGGEGETGQLAQDQNALREALGRLMGQFGQSGIPVPKSLSQAGQAMGDAATALGQGEPKAAVRPQTQALEALRRGAEALAQRHTRPESGAAGGRDPGTANEDPLGRPADGFDMGDSVHIPDHGDVQQSREILDELYRRAGDRDRPEFELDYLDRLLNRF